MGLHDAYDRSKEIKELVGAKETKEIPNNDMMRTHDIITPNDIEMLIEAWKTNAKQHFYTANDGDKTNFIKSPVIKLE